MDLQCKRVVENGKTPSIASSVLDCMIFAVFQTANRQILFLISEVLAETMLIFLLTNLSTNSTLNYSYHPLPEFHSGTDHRAL